MACLSQFETGDRYIMRISFPVGQVAYIGGHLLPNMIATYYILISLLLD